MNSKAVLLFEKTLKSEDELKALVEEMILSLLPHSILLLSGDLGAGKTTTVRSVCEHFGFQDAQSPTYAIHQHHENSMITIDHFDLYRLQNEEDLDSTGFWDLLHTGKGLVLIEWYEKIGHSDWLESEIRTQNVFGLKIQVKAKSRIFSFFRLDLENESLRS